MLRLPALPASFKVSRVAAPLSFAEGAKHHEVADMLFHAIPPPCQREATSTSRIIIGSGLGASMLWLAGRGTQQSRSCRVQA